MMFGEGWAILGTTILLIIDYAIRVVALFVVPRNRRPTSGIAWLMVIFWLPIPGMALFLLIGGNRLPKKRMEMQASATEAVQLQGEAAASVIGSDPSTLPVGVRNAVELGQSLGAQPMLRGNILTTYVGYEEAIAQMAATIRAANRYVHLEFYLLVHDETTDVVFRAMREAISRGVQVRVLLDHVTTVRNPGRARTTQSLTDMGAEWADMLPVRPWRGQWQRPDLRNHRKLLVVDGKIGFMGSQNLVDPSYNKRRNLRRGLQWRDLMVRVEGPAVMGLEAVFLSDWFVETKEAPLGLGDSGNLGLTPGNLDCQVLPSGPGFAQGNNLQVFVSLLYTAVERISITSPYFVPDGTIMTALRAATTRGVKVELFVSEVGDQPVVYHAQRSYYDALLEAGVRIWMYKPPYILHSKHFTIDNDVAVVGSSNMDQRSFDLNMEVSMVVYGESFVRDLTEATEEYRSNSRELTREEWDQQPLRSQLLDNLARLTSALQ